MEARRSDNTAMRGGAVEAVVFSCFNHDQAGVMAACGKSTGQPQTFERDEALSGGREKFGGASGA
jgi:hypothetical protein